MGTPYCGAPPIPGGAVWNFDPLLLLALGLLGLACLRAATPARRAVALAGWAVLALALVSPLCNLAVALFSLRIAQHLLIVLVAAPLLAAGLPAPRAGVTLPALFFALTIWFWHLPAPYAASFAPDGIAWWVLHVSLLVSAVWLWSALRACLSTRPEAAAVAGLFTGIQMGVLGALLTFAPRPLYAPHALQVTMPWGLTPLEDQQLGGLLMWVPGGLVLAAVLVALAALWRPAVRSLPAVLLLALPAAALAQGNDATSTGQAPTERRSAAAPVGVLTTSEVTTGSSGPSAGKPDTPAGADRRQRVLAPVCAGLTGAVLTECRAKSGS